MAFDECREDHPYALVVQVVPAFDMSSSWGIAWHVKKRKLMMMMSFSDGFLLNCCTS